MAEGLTLAVARAIRIARAHPAVQEARVSEDVASGIVQLELDIQQELPSAWRAAGESPSHVRAVETATILFPPGYPKRAPRTFLREDFDRQHPHLLPTPPGLPPQPCVVNGLPGELIQARGFEGYLDQLVDWLDKAAMLELNSEEHGWEPVRRDHLDDEIIIDRASLPDLIGAAGEGVVVRTDFVKIDDGDDSHRLIRIALNLDQPVSLTTAGCRVARTQDCVSWGHGVALILSAPDSEGAHTIINSTLPETVATVDDLVDRAKHYGCEQAFRAKLDHLSLLLAQGSFSATPLAVVFLVRRPFRVIGTTSSIEICPYAIDLKPGEELLRKGGDVRLCGLRDEISPALLKRASGDDETSPPHPWLLLGCGSVGSKVGLHLARRGQGPLRVVDRAMMSPHNFARHGLLPEPNARGGLLTFKADALASALSGFRSPIQAERGDIMQLLSTEEGRRKFDGGGLVLNTTGSSAVREALVSQSWEKRPALGEAHLLGAGNVAYAAFEGAEGNPSLSDLAAESYRLIAADEQIRSQVFSAKTEALQIGQGCGAVTFPMPDSRLSAFAAGLGDTVFNRLSAGHGTTAPGQITLGEILPDGLSQSWRTVEVDPWIVLELGDRQVRISARVNAMIRQAIAARPGVETGGVIVGRYLQMSETFQVVDLIEAPPDSIFTAARFTLGTRGLRPAISRLIRETGGSLYVLGTWHNHLVPSGPSTIDAETAIRLALRQFYPALMLIAHADGYTGLASEMIDVMNT